MKKNLFLIIMASILLIVSACGNTADQDKPKEDEKVEENEEEMDAESAERITETGIYNGQADPHTIEIETDEGPQAFQLTLDARDDVENLVEGEEVTYTYFDNGEQLVIEKIALAEENGEEPGDDSAERITETGIYNGQADPHTIEIETKEGPQAFQLTMEARDDVEKLVEGKEVTYTFYKDGEQLVIEKIVHEDEEASGDGSDSGDPGDSGDDSVEKITETGVYNGQADPHTIEIETEKGPQAFQLTMEARDDVDKLTEGNEVTYTYYKDGEQLIIEKIE